jgi:glutamine amidotransferase
VIALIDYEMGNLPSVQNALRRLGFAVQITDDPRVVEESAAIVLPGVGAFGTGMARLRERGLVEPIRAHAEAGKPILGICLGMQLLFTESEEFGQHEGLGLIPGRVTRMPSTVKLPHMGWNQVSPVGESALFAEIEDLWVYYDHTYAVEGAPRGTVVAESDYGRHFPAIVARGSVVGMQFHPEKSAAKGLRLLANWGRLACL